MEGGARAHYDGATLGHVQGKRFGWHRPLIPFGAPHYAVRVRPPSIERPTHRGR